MLPALLMGGAMFAPQIARAGMAIGRAFLRRPIAMTAAVGGTAAGAGLLAGRAGAPGAPAQYYSRRRRRRRRLTSSMLNELNMIKAILGKTAAANALPFYLK